MPTYEYKCESCGSTFDVFQSITARPFRRHECPACGAVRSVRRLIGAGGAILFKGSGFYATDYRSKPYQEAAKAESSPSSKDASDNSKSSPSKTADGASKPVEKKKPAKAVTP